MLTGKSRPFCWFRVQRWRAQSLGIVVSSRPRRWCLATRHSAEMTTVGPAVVRRVQSRPSAVTILRLSCDCCATACDCHTTVLSVVDGHDRGPLRQSCDCRVLFCATVLLLSYDCRATVARPFCCCLTTIVTLSCDCHTTVVRQSWQQSWRVVATVVTTVVATVVSSLGSWGALRLRPGHGGPVPSSSRPRRSLVDVNIVVAGDRLRPP